MKKILLPLTLVGCCSVPMIQAAEIDFSGFATIAGGMTSDSDESLEGYDDSISFSDNSLIALQASAEIGNGWGVTTQLISRSSNEWELDAEWAFISYDTDNDWRFLFGRQRAPFYVYSDYLDVSYAYHWIRPPSGVYSLPFDTVDGVGAIKNTTMGSFDSTFHLSLGRNKGTFEVQELDTAADFGDFYSLTWTLNRDWFTGRISYARSTFSVYADAFSQLTEGWRAANFPQVADSIEVIDDTGDFKGVGFIFDLENWLIVTEYTEVDPGDSYFAANDSFYISAGYRTNSGMIHLTVGADENSPNLAMLNDIPTGVDPGLDQLIVATDALLRGSTEDATYAKLGYKHDLDLPISLKFELTKFNNDFDSSGDSTLLEFAIVTVF